MVNQTQNYPFQNNYQQPQSYYPPMQQNYAPQQSYAPSVQNSFQQTDLNELDNGKFKCFKILLILQIIIIVIGNLYLTNFFHNCSALILVYFIDVPLALFRIILITYQIRAMKERNLKNAKFALKWFLIFLVWDPIRIFVVNYRCLGSLPERVYIPAFIQYDLFILFVIIGSVKVYEALKENQKSSDNYHAAFYQGA